MITAAVFPDPLPEYTAWISPVLEFFSDRDATEAAELLRRQRWNCIFSRSSNNPSLIFATEYDYLVALAVLADKPLFYAPDERVTAILQEEEQIPCFLPESNFLFSCHRPWCMVVPEITPDLYRNNPPDMATGLSSLLNEVSGLWQNNQSNH